MPQLVCPVDKFCFSFSAPFGPKKKAKPQFLPANWPSCGSDFKFYDLIIYATGYCVKQKKQHNLHLFINYFTLLIGVTIAVV